MGRIVTVERRGARILLPVILVLWGLVAAPLVLGDRTLVLRDVLTTHLPYKWFGAQALAAGEIPAFNDSWALGQPFRGNPNALPFYPGNLLYLAFPFWSAFGLHYMLHWLLAFLGMRHLARSLGQGEPAAMLAGVAYAGSGYLISTLTFYNLLTVAAWAPWVLAGLVVGGRRGVATGGLACGLMLLGGEPVSAALVTVAMLVAALERRSLRQALPLCLAVGGLGLALAGPQLVAMARVLPFTYRAAHGIEESLAGLQALHPLRLLELVLPLPWGWPGDLGRFGYWSSIVTPHVPYIYSLHVGVIAAALAVVALPRHRRWALLALAALLAAWAGGLSSSVTAALTAGLFRYPQKLLLLFTLAAAPLAGWGLDRARESRTVASWLAWIGGGLVALSGAAFFGQARLAELLGTYLVKEANQVLARTQAGAWTLALALAGISLAAAAWALGRRAPSALVAIQVVALLQFAPAVLTDEVGRYARPSPFAARIETPRTLLHLPMLEPEWEPWPQYHLGTAGQLGAAHAGWLSVEAPFGVVQGIAYPLAPDLEGMSSPLSVFVARNLTQASWPVRLRWLERLGVGWMVRAGDAEMEGFERVESAEQWGVTISLYRVLAPAARVRWPEQVEVAASPVEAYARISLAPLDAATSVASRAVDHHPGARLETVEWSTGRIEVKVAGDGGLLVLDRAYQPLWRARLADGTPLRTQPVDVELLGVEVPAGEQRVVIDVDGRPETVAGGLSLLLAAALVAVSFLPASRS